MSESYSLGRKKALADAAAGVAGSVISLWTFYPIEVLKTNLQAGLDDKQKKSMFHGCQTKTLHTIASSFCYFYLYSYILAFWKKQNRNAEIKTSTSLFLTALAAMLNTAITLPLDVISNRNLTTTTHKSEQLQGNNITGNKTVRNWDMQECTPTFCSDDDSLSSSDSISEYHDTSPYCEEEKKEESFVCATNQHKNVFMPTKASDSEEGYRGLWKGLTPALLLCSNPSINYTIFDMAKRRLMKTRKHSSSSLTMSEAFLVGLFAKFVATIATYPLIRAKILMMVTSEKSLIATLCRTYREEGVRGLFKGCDWQLLHTVLKSALMMMVREKISHSTHRLIVGETNKR